jgi:hypothetical protein
MTEEKVPTVVEALSLVMDEVQSISKASRNTHQNFNFRGIDAVMNAVGPAFRKHGVVCVPTGATYEDEHYQAKGGSNMRSVTLTVTFRFYGPAGDFIDASACGESADAGDKAVPKAHSVAYRTLLLQALCIPTDDPDPDASTHHRETPPVRVEGPPPPAVPTSWPKVKDAFRKCDNPEESEALYEAFLRAATYHLYGKESLKEISADERKVVFQKAAGAVVWLQENVESEGPGFLFFGEAEHRKAWASVLEGHLLEIPDYVQPEPPAPPVDEEAERLAREAFADAETGYGQ